MGEDCVVVRETGVAANLVCLRLLGNRNPPSGKRGLQRKSTNPASARFKFGDGRLGKGSFAAESLRHLRRMRIFRRYCEKGQREPLGGYWVPPLACRLFGNIGRGAPCRKMRWNITPSALPPQLKGPRNW